MKNEDKIVELLSEQIKKQDSQEELLAKQEELLKKVVAGLTDLTHVFEMKFDQVNNHESRITRLEDRLIA